MDGNNLWHVVNSTATLVIILMRNVQDGHQFFFKCNGGQYLAYS